MSHETEQLKKSAGVKAVDFLRSGMLVGLGTGSTAEFAVRELSERMSDGRLSDIICIPSSHRTKSFAEGLGLNLASMDQATRIDVTIDGADEIDPDFNLIKGGGGALLKEKVLAQNSVRNIIVADESKLSPRLGVRFPVPVEVTGFALEVERSCLKSLGGKVTLRLLDDGSPFLTEQGNFILDWRFGEMENPSYFAGLLSERAGIMEHGLFIGTAHDLIVGYPRGAEHVTAVASARTSGGS